MHAINQSPHVNYLPRDDILALGFSNVSFASTLSTMYQQPKDKKHNQG